MENLDVLKRKIQEQDKIIAEQKLVLSNAGKAIIQLRIENNQLHVLEKRFQDFLLAVLISHNNKVTFSIGNFKEIGSNKEVNCRFEYDEDTDHYACTVELVESNQEQTDGQ